MDPIDGPEADVAGPGSATSLCLSLTLVRETGVERACLVVADHRCYAGLDPALFLHPLERTYLDSLTVHKRRLDFTLGRHVAKQALCRLDPALGSTAVQVRPGVFGQPVVTPSGAAPLSVCIAHSGPLAAALAFPQGHPLGLDLEQIEPDRLDVLRTQIRVDELPPGDRMTEIERYTRVWTVKEALSKILCCGLTCPFELLGPSEEVAVAGSVYTGGLRNFTQYGFRSLAVPGMALALVHPARTRIEFEQDRLCVHLGEALEANDRPQGQHDPLGHGVCDPGRIEGDPGAR